MIQIDGKINRIEVNDSSVVLVYVYKEDVVGDKGIKVFMHQKFEEPAKRLSKIRDIKVKGLCKGYDDSYVVLKYGSIIEVSD